MDRSRGQNEAADQESVESGEEQKIRKEKTWNHIRGPIGATIKAVETTGWKPISPDQWLAERRNEHDVFACV